MLEKKRNRTGGSKKIGFIRLNFKLPQELKEKLEKKSVEMGIDVSSLLRIMILDFLKNTETKQTEKKDS